MLSVHQELTYYNFAPIIGQLTTSSFPRPIHPHQPYLLPLTHKQIRSIINNIATISVDQFFYGNHGLYFTISCLTFSYITIPADIPTFRPIQLVGFRTDLIFLTGITLVTYAFAITGKKYSFNKREGLGLLSLYVLFVLFQVFRA